MKKGIILFIFCVVFSEMCQAQLVNCMKNLPELIPYCKGNKWGFCDKNKKVIISPVYESVAFFGEDFLEHY